MSRWCGAITCAICTHTAPPNAAPCGPRNVGAHDNGVAKRDRSGRRVGDVHGERRVRAGRDRDRGGCRLPLQHRRRLGSAARAGRSEPAAGEVSRQPEWKRAETPPTPAAQPGPAAPERRSSGRRRSTVRRGGVACRAWSRSRSCRPAGSPRVGAPAARRAGSTRPPARVAVPDRDATPIPAAATTTTTTPTSRARVRRCA